MSEPNLTFVIKRTTKRPSGIHAVAEIAANTSWIEQLHRLWRTPQSRRRPTSSTQRLANAG